MHPQSQWLYNASAACGQWYCHDCDARVPRYGWTALHRAAQNNNEEMARALLEHGADANRIDMSWVLLLLLLLLLLLSTVTARSRERTALDEALLVGHNHLAHLLRTHGVSARAQHVLARVHVRVTCMQPRDAVMVCRRIAACSMPQNTTTWTGRSIGWGS